MLFCFPVLVSIYLFLWTCLSMPFSSASPPPNFFPAQLCRQKLAQSSPSLTVFYSAPSTVLQNIEGRCIRSLGTSCPHYFDIRWTVCRQSQDTMLCSMQIGPLCRLEPPLTVWPSRSRVMYLSSGTTSACNPFQPDELDGSSIRPSAKQGSGRKGRCVSAICRCPGVPSSFRVVCAGSESGS
jgi:hypothetical protein